MATLPTLTQMLKAGVHFGHQRSRWHPKMEQYLFGARNGVHVIDLDQTLVELDKSLTYVKELAASGKTILFVGTKRQARELITKAAQDCGMPFLTERWIGGLLTNFEECRRRLKKYKGLKEMFATGEIEKYTKKEQVSFKKQIEKMDKYLHGLVTLDKIPDALYIADVRVEKTAVTEAIRMNVPTVAICDSNVDPTKITHPIPANDDAVNAIAMMATLVAEAVKEGKAEGERRRASAKEEKPVVKGSPAAQALAVETMPAKDADKSDKPKRRAIKKEETV